MDQFTKYKVELWMSVYLKRMEIDPSEDTKYWASHARAAVAHLEDSFEVRK